MSSLSSAAADSGFHWERGEEDSHGVLKHIILQFIFAAHYIKKKNLDVPPCSWRPSLGSSTYLLSFSLSKQDDTRNNVWEEEISFSKINKLSDVSLGTHFRTFDVIFLQ